MTVALLCLLSCCFFISQALSLNSLFRLACPAENCLLVGAPALALSLLVAVTVEPVDRCAMFASLAHIDLEQKVFSYRLPIDSLHFKSHPLQV